MKKNEKFSGLKIEKRISVWPFQNPKAMAIAFIFLGVFLFTACTNPGGNHSTAGKKNPASSKEDEIIALTEQTFSELKSDIQKNGEQNELLITDVSGTNLSKYN